MSENTLGGLSDIIREQGEQKRREDEAFNDSLPEPDAILKYANYEFGFFKVVDGIERYQKYANGYNKHSHVFISNEEIAAINEAHNKEQTNAETHI